MNRRQFLKTLSVSLAALAATHLRPLSAQDQAQVEAFLSQMTLREKIGQMFMFSLDGVSFGNAMQRVITDYHLGGLALFDYNIGRPEVLTRLTNDIQNAARIPLFLAVDQEGGRVQRLWEPPFNTFPNAMALGAADNPELTRQIATAIAEEMRACGLNMNFAPVLDVNRQPGNPVINVRAFGSDPVRVAEHGVAYIEGMQQNGIIATGKHFPGHGSTTEDSHYTLPIVALGEDEMWVDMLPFRAGITADLGAVMSAHVQYASLDFEFPATFSTRILTDLLRTEMGFQRVVISDALTMRAVEAVEAENILVQALNAGVDLLAYGALPNGDPPSLNEQIEGFESVLAVAQSGGLSEERINASVRRVLELKARFGLLEKHILDITGTLERMRIDAHRALIEQAAAQSITLYRDQPLQLPLDRNAPLAIVVPAPVTEAAAVMAEGATNAISMSYPVQPTLGDAQRITERVRDRQVICLTLDAYRYPDQFFLIDALPLERTVVVAIQSPYDILKFPQVQTYLMSYGTDAAALAAARRVIFGDAPALGRLPVNMQET